MTHNKDTGLPTHYIRGRANSGVNCPLLFAWVNLICRFSHEQIELQNTWRDTIKTASADSYGGNGEALCRAIAAAVAFSLTYFDKWVTKIERKFPHLGQ